jgi:hypothetical protein
MADVSTGSGGEPRVEPRGGRESARPARTFRYRAVALSGANVGAVESERALRPDDVVEIRTPVENASWRVVSVLGTCAVVVRD